MVLKAMKKAHYGTSEEIDVDIFICKHVSITNSQQILTKCSLHTHVPWHLCWNLPVYRWGCSPVRVYSSPCQRGKDTKATQNQFKYVLNSRPLKFCLM